MIGGRGLADALAQFLYAEMPGNVDRLATELGQAVDDPFGGDELLLDAQPQFIASTQIPTAAVAIDLWPFVVVVVGRMTAQRRVGVDGSANVQYERDYTVRLWYWARGDGFTITAAVRDRGLLALGETLLRGQTFGTAEGGARINEEAWREEYSDVGEDPVTRATEAAAFIETTVTSLEWLTSPNAVRGVANTIQVDTRSLPVHPALA